MRYVLGSLSDGEQVVLGPIRKTLWEYFPWGLLIVPIGFIWLRRWSTEYAITSHRLISKRGLIARNTDELRLTAIESVQIRQSVLGRLFDYGDLVATGRGNQVIHLENVRSPLAVKKQLESLS